MASADETYYRIKRLHVVFAVAVFALAAATAWMWAADVRRPWKDYQRAYRQQRGLPPQSPAIQQIWLPDLTLNYNFRNVARFDRCTTCHQGIDGTNDSNKEGDSPIFAETKIGTVPSAETKTGTARLAQPYAPHPRLDLFVGAKSPHPAAEFGCTICHDGQGSATEFRLASHTPNDRQQRQDWRQRLAWSPNPHWDLPMLARRFSECRCLKCHRDPVELEPSDRFSDPPAASLMAGYHLVRQYGCFGCHEIPALKNVNHKVGPDLRNIAGKFNADYLAGRIRNPADVLPTTRMPRLYGLDEHLSGRVQAETRRSEDAEIRTVVEYLLASSAKVTGSDPSSAASGAIVPPSAERGKQVFETQGCLACHQHRDFPKGIATQGPDLSNVGAKYTPGSGTEWLIGWLRNPARYSPQTLMPNPFLQLIPLDDEKNPSDPAADLATYLMERGRGKAEGGGLGTSVPSANPPQSTADRDFALRTIAKRGCAGCHEIRGLKDVPAIGPSLAGWGEKSPSLLAFEQIDAFLAKPSTDSPKGEFYRDALLAHRREGFAWQKLRAPRSFDYCVAERKPIAEQLKMGRFELTDAQREAIVTFIVAQVEETSSAKHVDHPSPRRQAIIAGRKVLDKYACAECHTLEVDRWTITLSAGRKIELYGMPRLDRHGELLEDEDDDGNPLHYFTLWKPAEIDGRRWPVGGADVPLREKGVGSLCCAISGGLLPTKTPDPFVRGVLYPAVLEEARRSGRSAAESEAWGWLPPTLVNEGGKVQPEWLFRFLLDPVAIRPATVLRMPLFNLSRAEAGKLADYFAAVGGVDYPYTPKPVAVTDSLDVARLDRAMRLVVDRTTYCSKCHTIDGRAPAGQNRTVLAPRLDDVSQRLRPEYLRRWLADPKSVLPYTAMPTLFPSSGKPLGQDVFPGSSREQLDAVVELLLRYNEYSKSRTPTPAP